MTSCDPQLLGQEPFFLTGEKKKKEKKSFPLLSVMTFWSLNMKRVSSPVLPVRSPTGFLLR